MQREAHLLRDSRGRWLIAISEDEHGLTITKVAESDAMDERELLNAGDYLVEIAGHPAAGLSLAEARQRIKDHAQPQLTLAVRRLALLGERPAPFLELTASLRRDSEGRWMIALGEDERGIKLTKVAESDGTDERALLCEGDYLRVVGGQPAVGLSLGQARQLIKDGGPSLELQVLRMTADDVEARVFLREMAWHRSQQVPSEAAAAPPQSRAYKPRGEGPDPFLQFAFQGTGVPRAPY